MSLVISDEMVRATRLSEQELAREIAVLLYGRELLTAGQAARMAQLGRLEFQRFAASRGASVHYDVEEFREDIRTLEALRRQ